MKKSSIILLVSIIIGIIVLVVGIVVGWVVMPNLIEDQIGENVELKKDTEQYERFEELPIPFDFKVYFFEITNRDKANDGEKPIMKEKGPYVYKQSRNKTNIVRNSNGTISYYEYSYFKFDQTLSGKLKPTDEILVINPALNSAIQILDKLLPALIALLRDDVIKVAFTGEQDQYDIYWKVNVNQFLFDGYDVCSQKELNKLTDPKVKADATIVCLGLYLMEAKNLEPQEDKLVFSLLGYKNKKHNGHYIVNDGISEKENLGRIEQWEGSEYMNYWVGSNSTCNEVKGRDAVLYPPFIKTDTDLTIFNTDICRTVRLDYTKELEFRDVTAFEFVLSDDNLAAPDEDLGNECYCLKSTNIPGMVHDNGCLKHGVLDLYSCYNAPIIMSFPHFLHAHPDYNETVGGMNPVEEEHRTYIRIEPDTGTPLSGSKRIQLNMFVTENKNVKFLEKYETPRLMPLLWLDEHVDITDELYDELYDKYVSKLMLATGVKWGIVGVGIFIIGLTLVITIWRNCCRSKKTV